ncbi:Programmed cell death protein 5 [Paragonimus heterotremus]|uniref:Programmed cell death protein 5 n=1 Tax=Paragonimus heterotremus TaxID=100268 RepID=A0A8J4SNJ8_9TREM|nr:Programmed cell death protein 5 [Paragonimus heterotremus]
MNSGDEDEEKQKQTAVERQKDMRASILAQILDQDSRARLNTIALTKPEKAQMVENMLINMAQTGRVRSKLNEDQFKQILMQLSSNAPKTTTVKFDRRRAAIDSDDDY